MLWIFAGFIIHRHACLIKQTNKESVLILYDPIEPSRSSLSFLCLFSSIRCCSTPASRNPWRCPGFTRPSPSPCVPRCFSPRDCFQINPQHSCLLIHSCLCFFVFFSCLRSSPVTTAPFTMTRGRTGLSCSSQRKQPQISAKRYGNEKTTTPLRFA